jgi:hypothetical protein
MEPTMILPTRVHRGSGNTARPLLVGGSIGDCLVAVVGSGARHLPVPDGGISWDWYLAATGPVPCGEHPQEFLVWDEADSASPWGHVSFESSGWAEPPEQASLHADPVTQSVPDDDDTGAQSELPVHDEQLDSRTSKDASESYLTGVQESTRRC